MRRWSPSSAGDRRCLEKDRTRRLDSAAAARLEIDDALTATPHDIVLEKIPAFIAGQRVALTNSLNHAAAWLDLLLFDLKDLPIFQYQVRADDFLSFENAYPLGCGVL